MKRRDLLQAGAAALALSAQRATGAQARRARVVVVGGGFGGATAAKYLRLLSGQHVEVVLVEPQADFISCPLSNLVLGGFRPLDDLRQPLDTLARRHGVQLVRERVARVDTAARRLLLDSGTALAYDKLLLSPGIDLDMDSVDGLPAAHAAGRVLPAWKAGPETLALRRQIEAMPGGGVFALSIPPAPYRCPPGPYERASVIAAYLRQAKPRAKLLVLDANPDIVSKGALFRKFWAEAYPQLIEYRPLHQVVGVEARPGELAGTLRFELQEPERATVMNVLPAMRAGSLLQQAGLMKPGARWCEVDYRTFAATAAPHVHVIGDAIQPAPAMPKSGHMANAHAKVAAAAIVAELSGWEPDPAPLLTNTCYSFVDARQVIHVASVHQYSAALRNYQPVAGSGGLSAAPSTLEGSYAWNWARTIWADMLA